MIGSVLMERQLPIDWASYTPHDRAVLCFLRDHERVLLIRKKRGLGAGKINAPGGKSESGETPRDAAIRETAEEVGLTPVDPIHYGTLRFAFADGYDLEVHIFVAYEWSGRLVETDEAIPIWTPIRDIPYDEMWADDRHWLPLVLAGDHIEAEMYFDGDQMVTWDLRSADGTHLVGSVG
jgi:8-oxo-dGTP diphosphatase